MLLILRPPRVMSQPTVLRPHPRNGHENKGHLKAVSASWKDRFESHGSGGRVGLSPRTPCVLAGTRTTLAQGMRWVRCELCDRSRSPGPRGNLEYVPTPMHLCLCHYNGDEQCMVIMCYINRRSKLCKGAGRVPRHPSDQTPCLVPPRAHVHCAQEP